MLTDHSLQMHTEMALLDQRHQLCQQPLPAPSHSLSVHVSVSFHPSGYLSNEVNELLAAFRLHSRKCPARLAERGTLQGRE